MELRPGEATTGTGLSWRRWQVLLPIVLIAILTVGVSVAQAGITLQNSDCWSCHDPQYHIDAGSAFISCDASGCHDEFGVNAFTDAYTVWAHSEAPDNCTWCHAPAHPEIPQHDTAVLEDIHESATAPFDACADCHSPALVTEHADNCALCHSSTDPVVIAAIAANDVTCEACHDVDAAHGPLHDGATTDPTCLACHDGNASTEHADNCALCHSSTDPVVIAAIAANDVTCEACHDVDAAHGPLHDGATTDPTCLACHDGNASTEHADNCALCHSSTDPVVIAAIAANDVSCGACHDVAAGHGPLHDGATTDPTCLACHDGNASTEHADNCALCHSSTDPVVIAAIAANDVSCGACHDVAAGHGPLHDGATTDPTCLACHDGNASTEHADNCALCHSSTDPVVIAAIAANDVSCGACHDVAAGHGPLHDGATTDPTCLACHDGNASTEHADNCALCHSSTDPVVIAAIAANDVSCGACHDVGTGHGPLHDGGTADPSCLDCHEANISTEHADNCALCHSSTDPVVIAAIAANDVSCGACHDVSMGHDAAHDGVTGDPACLDCHGSSVVGTHGGGCGVCHASSRPEVLAAIASGSATCGTCHPAGHYKGASLDAYLQWADAQAIMTANGVDVALQGTPHGGYAANTTKCAVCHSVHRAASEATSSAGVYSYWKLTPAAQACTACHTAWGANPIPTALVEWANPADGSGGPHSSFNCLNACHAGIHGGTTSVYGAVTAFNLTNRNDAAIAAAFVAGNASDATGLGAGGSNKGTATYANINAATFSAYTTTATVDLSAMRAMATGYTCGASGCHSSSQFAVNKHGYAELRASNPGASTTVDQYMTGHITNIPSGCAPCHSTSEFGADNRCALCHDMRGKATNSTAFPHSNRNVIAKEYVRPAGSLVVTDTLVLAGNLWMYAGDATYRDASGVPTSAALWDGNATGSGTVDGTMAANRVNTRTIIRNAVGFHDGQAGDIRDGVCLKCHGYKYWPTHGINLGPSHGGSAALNFSSR